MNSIVSQESGFAPPEYQPKLWRPDEDLDRSVDPECTLTWVFESGIVPQMRTVDRRKRRRPASEGHIKRLRDTVRLWAWATGDPVVRLISDELIDWFLDLLPKIAWRRGRSVQYQSCEGAAPAGWAMYSLWSVRRTQDRLATILAMLGPAAGRSIRLSLLAKPPTVPLSDEVDTPPKDLWTLDECRAIAAGCERMRWLAAVRKGATAASDWWRAWVALCFYTGLRTGTVADLQWADVEPRLGKWWLHVHGDRASKTHKSAWIVLHRQCVEALEAIRPLTSAPTDWILERVYCRNQAGKTFQERLLPASGLGEDRHLPAKLWRAVHIASIKMLGADMAQRAGQAAADHASAAIGNEFYADTDNLLRPRLPDLWPGGLPKRLF